ncbi:hypothetical protein [Nocardia stercoris]|uniref:Uncharacterized protein n=1 Tax=Nocardia stercoris TaxID=2483361 RepID=A0A3M2KXY6_9NOCA|nr:hypothetical protein [Nocardia stercoris]RMI29516.1 hypothetical protein EBN03_25950 [Nocardia stercoris]
MTAHQTKMGHISTLQGIQSALNEAFQSPIAAARVQDALNNCIQSGQKLAQRLSDHAQALKDAGISIDNADMEAAAKVEMNSGSKITPFV